jgi:thymidine kinase
MHLTVILGPMKSGKSYELISYFAPLRYTTIPHGLYQSSRNVRDAQIESRIGTTLEARKVASLAEVLEFEHQIVGIDEFHMFAPDDVRHIETLLQRGTRVVVSSLDTDYQGRLFEPIRNLFELGPAEVKFKRAVCEVCKNPDAIYSQVYHNGEPVLDGMPPVIPDDGTFAYAPVCRGCFVRLR